MRSQSAIQQPLTRLARFSSQPAVLTESTQPDMYPVDISKHVLDFKPRENEPESIPKAVLEKYFKLITNVFSQKYDVSKSSSLNQAKTIFLRDILPKITSKTTLDALVADIKHTEAKNENSYTNKQRNTDPEAKSIYASLKTMITSYDD